MGVGAAVSSNVSSALASAFTNVLSSTNITYDQEIGQTEYIGFNNCDLFVQGDFNVSQTQALKSSLKMVASVENINDISNAIAQALTQSAQSSVGEMVVGYASASNVASTYASLNTNISNSVTQEAQTWSDQGQTFSCNNSTITVNGAFNLGQSQDADVSGDMTTNVSNTNTVSNSIQQTIEQSATASTGMDPWTFLILGIAAVVGVVAFKILETRAKNNSLQNSNVQNCVMEMSKQQTGTKQSNLMMAQASCPTCTDRCIEVNHASHLYTHWGWFIAWLVILVGMGAVIGGWYGEVKNRGCLHNDSCGSSAASTWASGCSCDMDSVMFNPTNACKSPVTEQMNGIGLPVKYQYPVLFADTTGTSATNSSKVGSASLQGLVVTSFKMGQTEYNSNNGNNLFTLLTYEQLWNTGNTGIQIKNLFNAAATYIYNSQYQFQNCPRLLAVISGADGSLNGMAYRLFRFMNPLRLKFKTAKGENNYLEFISSNTVQDEYDGTAEDQIQAQVYPVPADYRWNSAETTTSFGTCSITTMQYTTSGVAFSNQMEINDTLDPSFCTENARMNYPDDSSDYILNLYNNSTQVTSFQISDLLTNMSSFNDPDQPYHFKDQVGNSYTPLDVYCDWTDFEANGVSLQSGDLAMMRLLYAGILATQSNMGPSQNLWGVNTLLNVGAGLNTDDFAYSAGFVWNGTTQSDDCVSSSGFPCSNMDPGTLPTGIVFVTAQDGSSEGQYEARTGFAAANDNATQVLSGQGFTATSEGIGYCRDWFFNESTLIVLWIVFGVWFILYPAYIGIRAYVGESQTTANNREMELRQGSARSNQSTKNQQVSNQATGNQAIASQQASTLKQKSYYYLKPGAAKGANPFKVCVKTDPGQGAKRFNTMDACADQIPK